MLASSSDKALHLLPTATALLAFTTTQHRAAAQDSDPGDKRGLSWIGTSHSDRDNRIFAADNSPITWYKTWGAWPIREAHGLEFVPMIHSLENLDDDIDTIKSGDAEYVLTFNEPDGDTSGGGTDIDAEDAAKAWEKILELRDVGKKISLPATTGSDGGWEWLNDFNESCWDLYEDTGCDFDFVAAHWYGAFEGLASWAGRLHAAYPNRDVWVTEMALPQPADEEEVLQMMNSSLGFLDETDWIAKYAWFGAFRDEDANGWTGDVVSLFDDDGGLTELGSLYMGGDARGFKVGDSESVATKMRASWYGLGLVVFVSIGSFI